MLFYIAMHGRHRVVRKCFDNLKALQKRFNFDVFVVCSSIEDAKICQEYDWDYTIEDNYPLGRKMNLGMKEAMNHDFTHLIQLGSDDIITEGLLTEYQDWAEVDYFGVNRFIAAHPETKRAKKWIYGMEIAPINHPIGAGRVISKKALIEVLAKTDLWEDERSKVLDGDSDITLIKNGYRAKIVDYKGIGIIDIKDGDNINKYDECHGEEIEYALIERYL